MEEWLLGLLILVVGLMLLAVEAAFPGRTFMAIPGAVAVLLGVIGVFSGRWLFSQSWHAPAIALAAIAPAAAVTVWAYRRRAEARRPAGRGDVLVGRSGVVTVKVVSGASTGKVRIAGRVLDAVSEREIPGGTRVEVVSASGAVVQVEDIDIIAKWEREHREKEEK